MQSAYIISSQALCEVPFHVGLGWVFGGEAEVVNVPEKRE